MNKIILQSKRLLSCDENTTKRELHAKQRQA